MPELKFQTWTLFTDQSFHKNYPSPAYIFQILVNKKICEIKYTSKKIIFTIVRNKLIRYQAKRISCSVIYVIWTVFMWIPLFLLMTTRCSLKKSLRSWNSSPMTQSIWLIGCEVEKKTNKIIIWNYLVIHYQEKIISCSVIYVIWACSELFLCEFHCFYLTTNSLKKVWGHKTQVPWRKAYDLSDVIHMIWSREK